MCSVLPLLSYFWKRLNSRLNSRTRSLAIQIFGWFIQNFHKRKDTFLDQISQCTHPVEEFDDCFSFNWFLNFFSRQSSLIKTLYELL